MSEYLKIAREVMRERQTAPKPEAAEPLEAVLKGQALELWSDALGERFWLVADEDDVVLLGESRGNVYTATEGRFVVQIADPGERPRCIGGNVNSTAPYATVRGIVTVS